MKDKLLKKLEVARKTATEEAKEIFDDDKTVDALAELCKRYGLDKSSANKSEQIESYRVQYIAKKLLQARQAFMKTKNRYEELKIYLPWYRVLFACFRRIKYGVLNEYDL